MDLFTGWRLPRDRAGRRAAALIENLETRTLLADGITPSPGPHLDATVGVALTNVTVAHFAIADSTGQPGSKWRAHVDWGDGQSAKLIVPVQVGSEFDFKASHTYTTAGTFT